MMGNLLAALLFAIAPQPSIPDAGAPSTATEGDEIVITGYAKRYKFSGKQLRKAAKVYAAGKAAYAPASQLMFVVTRKKGGSDLNGVKLSLRAPGKKAIAVPLDSASRFVLPAFPKGAWELVANRGSGALEFSPLVVSPGTTDTDVRLGDMRLECEVTWAAFIKPSLPLVARGVAAAIPGCRSTRFRMHVASDCRISRAWVSTGAVEKPVHVIANGHNYRLPTADRTLPNSACVRFRFD